MKKNSLHKKTEDYAYEEIKLGLKRRSKKAD